MTFFQRTSLALLAHMMFNHLAYDRSMKIQGRYDVKNSLDKRYQFNIRKISFSEGIDIEKLAERYQIYSSFINETGSTTLGCMEPETDQINLSNIDLRSGKFEARAGRDTFEFEKYHNKIRVKGSGTTRVYEIVKG